VASLSPLPTRVARALLLLVALAYWSPGTAEAGCTHLPSGFKPLDAHSAGAAGLETDPLHAPECSANDHSFTPTPPPPELVRQSHGLFVAARDPNFGLTSSFPRTRSFGEPHARATGIFHPPRHG
jgi:hypothetical protein